MFPHINCYKLQLDHVVHMCVRQLNSSELWIGASFTLDIKHWRAAGQVNMNMYCIGACEFTPSPFCGQILFDLPLVAVSGAILAQSSLQNRFNSFTSKGIRGLPTASQLDSSKHFEWLKRNTMKVLEHFSQRWTCLCAPLGKMQHCFKFSPFVDNGSHCGALESQSFRNGVVTPYQTDRFLWICFTSALHFLSFLGIMCESF